MLLLFEFAFGVMRNDLFVFKIILPTSYYWQKITLTETTTRCHSRSLTITYCRSLLLIVPLVLLVAIFCTTLCDSLSFNLSLVCFFITDPKKTSNNQMKTFACALQSNALT